MPILEAEPELFPESLLMEPVLCDDGYSESTDTARSWWVSHTRPRQEKALARQLFDEGVPYYLPCDRRRVRVRSRVVTSRVPLFGGYLFVRITEAERLRVLNTNRVAGLLKVSDQVRLLRDLQRVYRVLDLGAPITAESRLEPGTSVTVRHGPLAGMTGTVVKAAGGFKFIVSVDFISRGLSVLMDGASLGINE